MLILRKEKGQFSFYYLSPIIQFISGFCLGVTEHRLYLRYMCMCGLSLLTHNHSYALLLQLVLTLITFLVLLKRELLLLYMQGLTLDSTACGVVRLMEEVAILQINFVSIFILKKKTRLS